LTSRFRLGGFEALGFAGESGEDHMRHLRWVSVFWERLAVLAGRR
jgi:hypothetical protein